MNSEIIAQKLVGFVIAISLRLYELDNQPIGDDYTSVKKKNRKLYP